MQPNPLFKVFLLYNLVANGRAGSVKPFISFNSGQEYFDRFYLNLAR